MPVRQTDIIENLESDRSLGRPVFRLPLSAKIIARLFIGMMGLILLGYIATQISKLGFGHDVALGFVSLFDLWNESNLPTWFSSFLLLCAASLLALIATAKRHAGDPYAKHWVGLALVFLYLSIDETAMLHELIGTVFAAVAGRFSAFFATTWVWMYPFLVIVAAFGVVYLRFLFALPRRYQWLFVVSGIMYVGGALGLEFVEAYYKVLTGVDLKFETGGHLVVLATLIGVEEMLEMGGIVLFVVALLRYLQASIGSVAIDFRN
jgi:hypothetical protein